MSLQWLGSLLWCKVNPWPGNLCMLWAWPRTKKKKSELSKHYEGKESGHEEKSDWVANVVKEVGGHLWEGDI